MIKIHRDFGEGGRRKKLRLALVILVKLAKVKRIRRIEDFVERDGLCSCSGIVERVRGGVRAFRDVSCSFKGGWIDTNCSSDVRM
ncbi:hypothetical protein P8452_58609 [Trifolium repens]|nr:hypothetical protein P8452_58609 [Trifolium repens]